MLFVCLIALVTLVSSQTSCPNPQWVECANEDNTCTIYGMNATTIAYGHADSGNWVFTDITSKDSSKFSIHCNNGAFGDISDGDKKVCCYDPRGSLFSDQMFWDEENWAMVGYEDDWVTLPQSSTNFPTWVRYGAEGQFTYRLFQTEFDCNNKVFGDPIEGPKKYCYYYKVLYNITSLTMCGYEKESDGNCNLNANQQPSNPSIRIVKYGIDNRFYYRFVYSQVSSVPCQNELFDDPYDGPNKYCEVLPADASNFFSNPVGYWFLINSCVGCEDISTTISQGVTSESSYATTTEWSTSLTATVGSSLSFKGGGITSELSSSTAMSIANTMSSTFSQTLTKSCSASCSGNPGVYMFQWMVQTNEQLNLEINPFDTFQCGYVCKTNNTYPACPLGYCADTQCSICLDY